MAATGNVRYSQIRAGDRTGDGARLVTAASGALSQNVPLLYDADGNVIATATRSGNTTQFATVSGTKTTGKQLEFDASGNVVASVEDIGAGGGGGGGLTLLEEQVASVSASLDFTASISTDHDLYLILLNNIIPSVNSVRIYIRFSTNGGSSWVTSNDYGWGAFRWNAGGNVPVGSGTDSGIGLNNVQVNTAAGPPFSAAVWLHNPLSSTAYKALHGTGTGTGATFDGYNIYGGYNSTTAVDAFQVLAFLNTTASDITSGVVRCYGVQKP